jgi:shikimate kinase
MRGVGSATAAITVVNALFTGVGAAAAVDLRMTAEVELEPGAPANLTVAPECDSPLARATLADACRRYGGSDRFGARLQLTSAIPVSKGLKSSSAVGIAVGRAVCHALGVPASPEALAKGSADVAQAIGLSATGAFDDAMASAAGGVVVTENTARTVLARGVFPDDSSVLVWPGAGTHAPSPHWHDRFRAAAVAARPAIGSAGRGDWVAAMESNSELVESIVGYDYAEVRRKLRVAGAVGSGVSGLGPALATVVPRENLALVRRSHPAGADQLLALEFVRPSTAEAPPP